MGGRPATLSLNPRTILWEALTGYRQTASMKRIAAIILLSLLTSGAASADTLASQLKSEAQRLIPQVSAAETSARSRPNVKPTAIAPVLSTDLQRFGLAASRLSGEINQRGGPADLRCIFRGMAEETGKQLSAANAAATGAEQAKALARLTHTLKDAVEIAPAVGGHATAASSSRVAAAQCPAVQF